jgi:hypothetical protein
MSASVDAGWRSGGWGGAAEQLYSAERSELNAVLQRIAGVLEELSIPFPRVARWLVQRTGLRARPATSTCSYRIRCREVELLPDERRIPLVAPRSLNVKNKANGTPCGS